MLRRIVFWTHLSVGLVAGTIIFVLCLTGAILAFELQLVAWAEHDARARPEQAGAELLPPAEIAAQVALAEGERITSLEWSADADMPVRAVTDKRRAVMLNGWTGEVLGPGAAGLRGFLRLATEVHTSLTLRPAGHWVVSCANAGFVFLIASGLWLWWPRQWTWTAFRVALTPRLALRGKARDWNWHTTLGCWFLAPLFVIATSGLVLSFAAVDTWWRAFAGTTLLAPAAPLAAPDAVGDAPASATAIATTWTQMLALIAARHPGWRSLVVGGVGAPGKDGLVGCTVNFGTPRQRARTVALRLDLAKGRIAEERRWANEDGPVRARAIARLGHTGEILGDAGQALGLLACLAGCVLVYTGFALSWRRFIRPRAEQAKAGPPAATG
jgi:uncharacterized iron-regulated membrane protein